MPEKTRTASGLRPSLPEVVYTLQEDSSIPGKINLSIEEEKRQLLEEHQRLLQKEDERRKLENESIKTLNTAFTFLRRFSEVIEADDFIEYSRRRIDQAQPDDRTHVIIDVLRSTSALINVVEAQGWER